MKLLYRPETDSLYIDLSEKQSIYTQEIAEGVVATFDEDRNIVGIGIDNASKKIALRSLTIVKLPFEQTEIKT